MAVPETAETKRRDGRQGRTYTSNPTTIYIYIYIYISIYILLHNAAPHIYIRESVDSLCRDGAGPPIVCVH